MPVPGVLQSERQRRAVLRAPSVLTAARHALGQLECPLRACLVLLGDVVEQAPVERQLGVDEAACVDELLGLGRAEEARRTLRAAGAGNDAQLHLGKAELLHTRVGNAKVARQRQLEAAGFDPADLLLTVVRKPDGTGHAVLTLRSTQGDFVLDNLDWRVLPWRETPYRFVKRQHPTQPALWQEIDEQADPVVSAMRR